MLENYLQKNYGLPNQPVLLASKITLYKPFSGGICKILVEICSILLERWCTRASVGDGRKSPPNPARAD